MKVEKEKCSVVGIKFVVSYGWFYSFKDFVFLKIILKGNRKFVSVVIKVAEVN